MSTTRPSPESMARLIRIVTVPISAWLVHGGTAVGRATSRAPTAMATRLKATSAGVPSRPGRNTTVELSSPQAASIAPPTLRR